MLETLLLAAIRLTGGRLAEVFFGVGYDGSAQVCTWSHPIAFYLDSVIPRDPPHIHVKLRVWSKGGHATTILKIAGERMRQLMTFELESKGPYVLEPSGSPVNLEFTLRPIPDGAAIQYAVGESIPFDLHMSRDWVKKGGLRLDAETSSTAEHT
jgi:hypothetical protein